MLTLRHLLFTFLLVLVVLPVLVLGKCPCKPEEEEGDENNTKALGYKIGAIASILAAGAIGVCLPVLGKTIPALSPEKNIFFVIKAFAAGVILSTGFIHVLPDAFKSLKSPCLPSSPWADFPFTGFVAMVSAIVVLMIDAFATSYFSQRRFVNTQHGDEEHAGHVHVHTHAAHGHAHGIISSSANGESELIRHRVIAQVLELGIVVHSVIIGIAVGVSESSKFIRRLLAALTFHQFFEGMGLGSCIAQAEFKAGTFILMGLFFSLTTPVGIVIGIGIAERYDENSHTALIVEGVLNAASAGILIYMSLVDLLAQDFMNPKMQNNRKLQIGANVSLLLGAGCMSLVAKWA